MSQRNQMRHSQDANQRSQILINDTKALSQLKEASILTNYQQQQLAALEQQAQLSASISKSINNMGNLRTKSLDKNSQMSMKYSQKMPVAVHSSQQSQPQVVLKAGKKPQQTITLFPQGPLMGQQSAHGKATNMGDSSSKRAVV